jgi:CBS domain-containing protein
VSDVMAEEAYFLAPEDTLDDIVTSMADHWVRHLPVLDEEGLVCGLVSVRDVLLSLVDEED